LRDQGVRHDLIAAVFALGEDDLVRLIARVNSLAKFLATEDGNNLLVAYRRASNIVAIEERRDERVYDQAVHADLPMQPEEEALARSLDMVRDRAGKLLSEEQFEEAMAELSLLRRPIDAFFDNVTVNTDDAKLRENRLRLLARIRDTMNQVADFSQIEG
jgi:glycyl-tRNA synthetase beta chain